MDHCYSCFGFLLMSALGFKAKVDPSLACFLACVCTAFHYLRPIKKSSGTYSTIDLYLIGLKWWKKCFIACTQWILRFTSGATPADLLAASMEPRLLDPRTRRVPQHNALNYSATPAWLISRYLVNIESD